MTPDFAYVLGDKGSDKFEQFVGHCCRAYGIMRKHSHMLITLFSLMLSTGIPELQKAEGEHRPTLPWREPPAAAQARVRHDCENAGRARAWWRRRGH